MARDGQEHTAHDAWEHAARDARNHAARGARFFNIKMVKHYLLNNKYHLRLLDMKGIGGGVDGQVCRGLY